MPIYEYKCPDGHVFELFQRMADDPPPACEICGKGPVERVLYPVAVHSKGSGFYSTDYGRKGRKPGGGGAETSTSSDSNSGGSADSGGTTTEKKAAEA